MVNSPQGGLPEEQKLPPEAVKQWKDRLDAMAISTRVGRTLTREPPTLKLMKSNYKALLKAQLGDDESISDAEMLEAIEEAENEYPYKDCYDQSDSESDDEPQSPHSEGLKPWIKRPPAPCPFQSKRTVEPWIALPKASSFPLTVGV